MLSRIITNKTLKILINFANLYATRCRVKLNRRSFINIGLGCFDLNRFGTYIWEYFMWDVRNTSKPRQLFIPLTQISRHYWALVTPRIHYSDDIMRKMASQITSLTIVYSTVYSGADQRNHQSFTSLGFVREIHLWPVNSPHKGPVTRKMFSFDDVIILSALLSRHVH